MKQLKNTFVAMLAMLVSFAATAQTTKQNKDDAKQTIIENSLQTKNFQFVPQAVTPLGGRTRQLSSFYDMSISNDSLISYLPYFGRAYDGSAAFSTKSALDFTSSEFDYNVETRKRGGWVVTIKPKDNRDVEQYVLTVSQKGFASLDVVSNNRQSISFTGYVTANK